MSGVVTNFDKMTWVLKNEDEFHYEQFVGIMIEPLSPR